jgi:hypothetical protein
VRLALTALALLAAAAPLASQAAGKFPPDSLINVQVFARTTPVAEVTAAMRGFALGSACAVSSATWAKKECRWSDSTSPAMRSARSSSHAR